LWLVLHKLGRRGILQNRKTKGGEGMKTKKVYRIYISKYEIRFIKWFVAISYKLPNGKLGDIGISWWGICKQDLPF